ncbi:unnamed protein product [Musa hybrid cultivar]
MRKGAKLLLSLIRMLVTENDIKYCFLHQCLESINVEVHSLQEDKCSEENALKLNGFSGFMSFK